MNTMFRNHKLVGVGLIAGISCLVANPAQATLFNFSYTFDENNPGVNVPTSFQGMVEGTPDGNDLLAPTITMFDIIQNGDFDNPVASLTDGDFISKMFTFDGIGLEIVSDPFAFVSVGLEDGDAASYVNAFDFINGFITEDFAAERWTLTAKTAESVPEGNMSVVSWLILAGIGGLSVKYGKRKSL